MSKYYFSELDDEKCSTLSYILDQAEHEGLDEVEVIEAKRMVGLGHFYCQHYQEVCEQDGQTCGKVNCDHYLPRNGKSGLCKHWGWCYESVGKKFMLKVKDNG